MIDLSLFIPGEIQLNVNADHVQKITVETLAYGLARNSSPLR
ncbi:hypothetical protein [Agrobacterium vitis]|nr:hypothetical protein [Agrobacterium vitis]